MKRTIAAIYFVLIGGSALAGSPQDAMKARELGQIIGTAEICGYDIDSAKVGEYVAGFLSGSDETTRTFFQNGSGAHKIRLQAMSETERSVTCASQKAMAEKYGLTP
ncbi:hypothetical protein JET14_13240 [Martelella lutilitoris]|uniref:Uncharacterized protein n=1 Tax=Martelella lutilitoris TaxID=2583532 RepID=A0A7T7HHI1_9HYPH|nr:hypothetical protein [Martelella lutilitoris]QQM29291.1 hypothetical protein JET14_13240 [Martelella lutilitoris]